MRNTTLFFLMFASLICVGVNSYAQDDCFDAITIPFESYSTCGEIAFKSVDLANSTYSDQEPSPNCGNFSTSAHDIWYKITVPPLVTSLAFHAFNSDYSDTWTVSSPDMAVYRGNDCSSLVTLGCFESVGAFLENKEIRWETIYGLIPGETLYIRVWDTGLWWYKFYIAASVELSMPEDNCYNPSMLSSSGCNILSTGDDIAAPYECNWVTTDNSVFYYFTVYEDDDQPYTITIQNGECWSNFTEDNPQITFAVYSWNGSTCAGIGGTSLAYQGCVNGTGTVTFSNPLIPGQYILAMDGYCTSEGTSLCLFEVEAQFIEDILVELNTTNATCGSMGTASVSVIQSCTGNPSIIWSTGETSNSIGGLSSGSYSVTISDGAACDSVVRDFTITNQSIFSVDAAVTGNFCDNQISATAEVTGALWGQCSFNWNTVPVQNTHTAYFTESGTYTVTAIFGNCQDVDTFLVSIHDPIIISNFSQNNCINFNTQYEVSFDVTNSGGISSDFYVYNGTDTVMYSGSYSEIFNSGESYSIVVFDLNECDYQGYVGGWYCGCPTFAGTLTNQGTSVLCEDECTEMIIHNGDEYIEVDDIMQFVLHSGEYPAVPIAISNTPEFCFSQITDGQFGVTYYISAIAGNNNNGNVDINDSCYSQSPAISVMWLKNPDSFISATELTICGLDITLNAAQPLYGLSGTWECTNPFIATGATSTHTHLINVQAANYGNHIFSWVVSDGICSGSDQVLVHFLEVPVANAGNDQIVCGNTASLQAVQSVVGSTGLWTGNGSFESQSSFVTDVTVGPFGQNTYIWRENVGICLDQDEVNVNFVQGTNPTIITTYDTVCGNTGNIEVINIPGNGSWAAYHDGILLSPAPMYLQGLTNTATSVTIGNYPQNELSRTVEFVWTETTLGNGIQCYDSVSTFITFSRIPIASVGSSNQAEICGNTIQLDADITGS